ncbi:hypothetical protein [Asaia prunellae]|uniref:hypothetical protein n=1 Tax=Asaia prunellae TaxID=610245 RepID=UPI00046FCADE|nr:hypothetical protein [Asaia prunellae]
MNDQEHPLPQLLEQHPDGPSHPERRGPRLAGFALIAGLALSGLAGLHHITGHNSVSGVPASVDNLKAADQPTQHPEAQLPQIPPGSAERALARSNYSQKDQARILAAYKRREISLIQMPIAELDGRIGETVRIDAGGFTQIVTLSDNLKAVTLPIYHAGEVTISPVHMIAGNTLAAGVLTVYGMYTLPTLSPSELVTLDVIAQ